MRTVFHNGVVHARADGGEVSVVVVEDGRIVWLGSTDQLGALDPDDVVVDLDRAFVAPAFVDAHVHLLETGLALVGVDLASATSLGAALDRIERAASHDMDPVLAHGWDESGWPERRPPTRAELDRAGGGRAVYAARADLHSAVVSSALAASAGCAEVEGWREDGLVTGDAHARARRAIRDLPEDRRMEVCGAALADAAAQGLVSVHEHSNAVLDTRESLASLIAATSEPGPGLPEVVGYRGELCETVDDAHALLEEIPDLTGIGGDLVVDGSLGSRTAALRSPYADGEPGHRGVLHLTAEQIADHVVAVTRAGRQAAFHVIGDRAMEEVLLGFQAASEVDGLEHLRGMGHRIEHAEMVDTAAMARILLFGLIVSGQPAFDATWGGPEGMYAQRLGRTRAGDMNPYADLLDAGVPLAFGSDSPVTPFDPWGGVRAAVHHTEASERLTPLSAFRAHTVGGWHAAGRTGAGIGELKVGAPAHFAVWRVARLAAPTSSRLSAWHDEPPPLPLPDLAEDLPEPECVLTVRDGVVIHGR